MNRRLPFVALWASLVYMVAAMAVSSKLCFDQLRVFGRGAAGVGTFQMMNAEWVGMTADSALERFWWLCASAGLGLLLISLSALWVSLTASLPAARPDHEPKPRQAAEL